MNNEMKKILTIAGSDCSGGAGIQADIKTITAHKMYAMSVITAFTAQNTTGVYDVVDVDAGFVGKQLDAVFTDIRPDAVKIGMVSNEKIIEMIVHKLQEYSVNIIIVDPVMVATSGGKLLDIGVERTLVEKLLPLATLITPNIPEAECLCGFAIRNKGEMLKAAESISRHLNGAVLIKGGHFSEGADDLLYVQGKETWFMGKRIQTENTHGTGCTLSSSVACYLAAGYSLTESVEKAKRYVRGALEDGLNLGKGNGPLNHCYNL